MQGFERFGAYLLVLARMCLALLASRLMHHILYASPGPTRALSRRLRCSKHLQPFFCSLFDLLRAAEAMCFLIGATGPGVTKTGEALCLGCWRRENVLLSAGQQTGCFQLFPAL